MITVKDCQYDGTIDLPDGRQVKIEFPYDEDHGAPWEECEGHGPVREVRGSRYTRPDKLPGERLMSNRHCEYWAYDFTGAMALAKRDGWGLGPDEIAKLKNKLGRVPTPGDIRAQSVENDFQYCADYLAERWAYVIIDVRLLDSNGDEIARDCLGGVESIGDYAVEEAARMANDLIEADDRERAESAYWLNREVVTV